MEPLWDDDTLLAYFASVNGKTLCSRVAGNRYEQRG